MRIGNYVLRYLADSNVEAKYHATVRRLTITDPLTLLLNRRALMDLLGRELARSARHNRPLSLGLFDVDGFKDINDRLGQLAGDLLLVQIAWRVKSAIRQEDVLARLGGDEFVILLADTPLHNAQLVAERVREVAAEEPFLPDPTLASSRSVLAWREHPAANASRRKDCFIEPMRRCTPSSAPVAADVPVPA